MIFSFSNIIIAFGFTVCFAVGSLKISELSGQNQCLKHERNLLLWEVDKTLLLHSVEVTNKSRRLSKLILFSN